MVGRSLESVLASARVVDCDLQSALRCYSQMKMLVVDAALVIVVGRLLQSHQLKQYGLLHHL